MNFSSINIQGNIISSEILDKIRSDENFKHQKPEAFGLARGASLRDEIGMAWALLRTHWQAYKKRLEMLPNDDSGTSLTREKWILPFLTELGYETSKQTKRIVNEKSYAISHGASNRDDFPIHIMGYNDNLDKRRETGGPRLSPHALVQEYLNNTEHLFALVTNGKHLRLLRDATRLVRMSYLEFDLERMMEEELYADFSILYRVLHVSRMPLKMDDSADSVIEFYHQESLASGSRIREKLSIAVEGSIKALANGFLLHPKNAALIELLDEERLSADEYYKYQLRLIYRILFLIVLEERKLIYPDQRDENTDRLRKLYFNYYSIERLRKLTEHNVYVDGDKFDLWQSLKTTFLLFEDGQFGSKLGIQPLGSGIFSPNALGILSDLEISNKDLLSVLRNLTSFYNEQKQLVRVNYSDLDVEEFGSVYEGLLEYDPKINKIGSRWEFSFVLGDKRSSSGSHYTPEELVKPLIKHSLDYIIADKLKVPDNVNSREAKQSLQEQQLLSIAVCDVACGSGHILLSAARKIATELASIREGAEQPSPTFFRAALRDVIKNCIYGVDLNPLAIDLCKVALWLEAHNPGEPLNFLDHHIKCGNSIVGLAHIDELQNGIADEAFKTLPGDDKNIAKLFRDKNRKERNAFKDQQTIDFDVDINNRVEELSVSYGDVNRMPEHTPEEVEAKAKAYEKLTSGHGWMRMQQLADMQIAQFFIPKTSEHQNQLITDANFRIWLNGKQQIKGLAPAHASGLAAQKKFFHWFLEFPTVMNDGGFDCILGNPPYLGGSKLSGKFGDSFLNFAKVYFTPSPGVFDLVGYFVKRIFSITDQLCIITTNSINQGDTREGCLDDIISRNGKINFAKTNVPWPGIANLDVTLLGINRSLIRENFLNDKRVDRINSYLVNDEKFQVYPLLHNRDYCFDGTKIYGDGFIINENQYRDLMHSDRNNKNVIFKYLGGDDINNNHDQDSSRYVINFFDWNENDAQKYKDCYEIVYKNVKPYRETVKRKNTREKWWQYEERRIRLYEKLKSSKQALCVTKTSKYLAFVFKNPAYVFASSLVVFPNATIQLFTILQSTLHYFWVSQFSSTLQSRLRYTGTDSLETFPIPLLENNNLLIIGKNLIQKKNNFTTLAKLGLTKTYNAFHVKKIQSSIKSNELEGKNNKVITKQYGKEVWNLWNHLQKTEGTCNWEEAVNGIVELRRLHKQMDEAVLEAYGWHEDSEKWGKAIALRHDFYEVDYLPENDRVRYTIHPDARKEVLKRLLLLNHERFEEEVMEGLHKKKDVEAFYAQKGMDVPEGVVFSDKKAKAYKTKSKTAKAKESKNEYGQKKLF